jgi:hypothetical protein
MSGHDKWRAFNSPDYLPLLGNFAVKDFLVLSRPFISFMRAFNLSFIDDLNSFRIFF